GTASVTTVAGAMVGVHVLIGIGEGVITGLVVSAVLASRPDLVWGARSLALDRLRIASPGDTERVAS
ncbi:MAG TPA: energy-coupling factor ABC transporter permease, partial [Acidimicrobiales bacterium]|nr:energy-coupling factor ABC transporter permease [Acidimicrobiales bacterium]